MSFSNDVRNEISSSVNDKDKRFACLYGMLLFSRTLTRERICFQSESLTSAKLFGELFLAVFREDVARREIARRGDGSLYSYDITDERLVERVFAKYRFDEAERRIDSEIIVANSLGVFAAGVFLACGSVNDPAKEYHLEFAAPTKALADDLSALLSNIGVGVGKVSRRGQYVVYIKGSESIEDTLTFIGAQQCTLELMNVKIYKDVRNKANRIRNCDAANIDKVLRAALKQQEDIKYIASAAGMDSLSAELREVAELRLENADMSLQEIGDSLSVPISRSGVNHRFKKLAKIAEELRNGGAGNAKR